MNDQQGMSIDLLRQRRNLIVLSLLLCFLKYAEVELGKLSVLGIEFKHFGRPETVVYSLWLGWAYFFARYSQYFFQEGWTKLSQIFTTTLDRKFAPRVEKLAKQEHPNNTREGVGTYTALKGWKWVFHGQENVGADENGTDKLNNFQMPIPRLKLWRQLIAAIISITFVQSAVTDYLLPFGLALFAAFYAGDKFIAELHVVVA